WLLCGLATHVLFWGHARSLSIAGHRTGNPDGHQYADCRSGQLAAVRRIAPRSAATEDPVDRYPAGHTGACHSGFRPAYPVTLTTGADKPDGLPVRRPAHHCHSRSVLDRRLLGIAGNTAISVLEPLAVNYRARGYCPGGR